MHILCSHFFQQLNFLKFFLSVLTKMYDVKKGHPPKKWGQFFATCIQKDFTSLHDNFVSSFCTISVTSLVKNWVGLWWISSLTSHASRAMLKLSNSISSAGLVFESCELVINFISHSVTGSLKKFLILSIKKESDLDLARRMTLSFTIRAFVWAPFSGQYFLWSKASAKWLFSYIYTSHQKAYALLINV